MKRLLLLMIAGVVLLTTGGVQAADFSDTGDGLWSNPANWSTGVLPTATEWAKISNNNPAHQTATIGAGVNALSSKTHIGYLGGGTLNIIDGGTLTTVSDDLLLGKNSGDGTVNLIDGTIDVWKDLEVGNGSGITGTLNMSSGLITVHDDLEIALAGTGIVNLDGGLIQLDGAFEGDSHLRIHAGGSLNFGGDGSGMLTVLGDRKNAIQAYIDAGQITSDLGGVNVDLTSNEGYTTVYAVVPEPATMVLLGLGGLFLRKRRS